MDLKKIIEGYTNETFEQTIPLKNKYLELCESESKKFMEYLKSLGYNSITVKHPFYRYNDNVVGDTYVLFDNNFNILENYNEDNNMKEDLTFFKDDEDRNKNGSRVKILIEFLQLRKLIKLMVLVINKLTKEVMT